MKKILVVISLQISRYIRWTVVLFILSIILVFTRCGQHAGPGQHDIIVQEDTTGLGAAAPNLGLAKLSEYGFFKGRLADLNPVDGVVPYTINTPLFSDYAHKLRFVKLPPGTKATYNDKEAFEFPVGTVLIKNFYYPTDFRDETKGQRIIETRLLIHKDSGWVGLPYIWNDEQTDATLEVTGGRRNVSWIHTDGAQRNLAYVIPNVNQCKGCHNRNNVMKPIGPSARQLNGTLIYTDMEENQLSHWVKNGMLDGLTDWKQAPILPVWNDPSTGSLTDRARAYLDINCGHCHRPEGPANTSGLFLYIHEKDPGKWGVNKTPIAAGNGSGGRDVDIVPGHPEQSILTYRMASTDPGEMMPELGRKIDHVEGIELIKEWIASLDVHDLRKTGNYSGE